MIYTFAEMEKMKQIQPIIRKEPSSRNSPISPDAKYRTPSISKKSSAVLSGLFQ